ncbi:MAG: Ig-like domain-containing protein [Solirubrobacterales bacterium]
MRAALLAIAALLIFAAGANANSVTVTYPVNGQTYGGPSAPSASDRFNYNGWAWTTDGFPEDVNVTLAYPECDVTNYNGDGYGIAWNCEQLGVPPGGMPSDGSHTFTVKRYPSTGSPTMVTDSSTFTIDTTAPVVSASLAAPPVNGFVPLKRPSITYSATDLSLATVTCSLDGAAASDCKNASPFTPSSDLADGAHSFVVVATDAVGNTGATATATLNFTVDTTPPVISLTSPTAGQTVDASSPGIVLSVTGGTAQCRYDAQPYVPCDAAFAAITLPDGPHSISVLATDLAGNTSSFYVLFTIDASLGAPAKAPEARSAKFGAGRAKTGKSGATKRTIFASIALPSGVSSGQACTGTATLTVSAKLGRRTKKLKKRFPLEANGTSACKVGGLFVLPKKFRHKRLRVTVSGRGNAAIDGFSFVGKIKN